jgi:hypothetical protein
MPAPSTTLLPIPKSWGEFEDICADLLKRIWNDPYVVRNGRCGQRQNGVDIYGYPSHLGNHSAKKLSGVQCKNVNRITTTEADQEAENARGFKPGLSEFIIMTTAPRDAKIQQHIRQTHWPFHFHIMAWDDISIELSGHDDLLKKHFPGWMKKTTSHADVIIMITQSKPEDYTYDDNIGIYVYKQDIKLRFVLESSTDQTGNFYEAWVNNFSDVQASRQPVYIYYGDTRLHEVYCIWVDGTRYLIPLPRSPKDLTIDRFKYHVGCILNHPFPGYGFNYALKQANIIVKEED